LTTRSALVVGGGAAGVSAAVRLQQAGVAVRVLEAGDAVGGRCRTVDRGGYRFDTGAGALPDTYDAVLRLVDAIGMADEIERRGAIIGTLAGGRVHRIDRRRPQSFLSARQLSPRSKAQLWRFGVDLARMYRSLNDDDLSTAARFDVETVREWSDRRGLRDDLRERFVAALCRALFLVEPEETSVVDLFGAAKSLLVAGHLLAHRDGVGAVVERAAATLDVALGARVVSVVHAPGGGARVRWSDASGTESVEDADACVVAVPAPHVTGLIGDLDDDRRAYLDRLHHSRSLVVQLGVRRAPAEPSSMVLIPRDLEPGLPVVGLGHNLAPGRAPAGGGVLTAFFMTDWSKDHWDHGDDELVGTTCALIDRLLPGWADDIETSLVTRWDPALVASRPGTYRDLAAFQARCDPADPIQLAGDYLARSSVNAAVRSGELAAERIAAAR
jgi:oxygen-dependent protoporphyrinogen oxidase